MAGTIVKSSNNPIHFVLIPMMAPGHMNPMVDLGKLLAERGMHVTIITTPHNALRFKSTADRALQTGLPLRFHAVQVFPSTTEDNCENMDSLVSMEAFLNFFRTADLLEEPLKVYLKEELMSPPGRPPLCIISDFIFLWSRKLATELEIPRFVFYSMPCFTLACAEILEKLDGMKLDVDLKKPFLVPEIPHRVELNGEQACVFFGGKKDIIKKWKEDESTADGVIVNTCMDIERKYVDIYRTEKGRRIWTIGPVALCNKDIAEKATRGVTSSSTNAGEILTFLDSMDPKSLIYVSFGTLSRTSPAQVAEICLGLMDSGYPFILVVQSKNNLVEIESWLEDTRFEERNKDKGMVIRGWAPQTMILSHPSLGGFVTHCGWNSALEGITAGVPMVTWPSCLDQFMNERFLVEVLKTGVMVGVKDPVKWCEEVVSVKREELGEAVKELMGGGEEAVKRRRRALELREAVDKAMDVGGSSFNNLNQLIQHVVTLVHGNN